MNALEIKNLSKEYPAFQLDHVSLALPMGSVMGFIGENGAGKSTTIHAVLGLLKGTSGSIHILGKDVSREIPSVLKEEIGVVLDECCLPTSLNFRDIDKIMKAAYSSWSSETFYEFGKRFSLDTKKKIKDYSRGMAMKLSIACALSHNAKLLILDEATSGLDPVTRDELLDLFYEFIQDEHHSIFMSSHITSDLEKICDYIAFLHEGRIVFCEEKDPLLERLGILKCSEKELSALDPSGIYAKHLAPFGATALVERRKIPGHFTVDPVKLEDIMIMLAKKED